MTRFVLCADDFALTDGISRAILELLAARRITATGAMTNRPGWPGWAPALQVYSEVADLGVHLNLTCSRPLGRMSSLAPGGDLPKLATVLRAALTSAEARREMAQEINRQLTAFEDAMGRRPDFVDGHQHVHAMPRIRDLVLEAVAKRYPPGSLYLRDPSDGFKAIRDRGVAVRKALTISLLARGFGERARKLGFPTNAGFSGVSPFDPLRDFSADMERFIISPGPRHLIMCHPGFIDAELKALDTVVQTRPQEFDILRRYALPEGCKAVRYSELVVLPEGNAPVIAP